VRIVASENSIKTAALRLEIAARFSRNGVAQIPALPAKLVVLALQLCLH
jgi:hypothetical protein